MEKCYITPKQIIAAFKKAGLSPTYKVGDWINIARPDGVHCEFYSNGPDNYAFTATYTVDGRVRDLDFYMPDDLDLFVTTVCKILEHN